MLSPLLAIDGEITISQCFIVSSVEEQRTHIKAMRRFNEMTKLSPKQWMSIAMRTNREHADDMESKDTAREEFTKEADDAMADLTRGEVFYGWHNLTVLAHGKDSDELDRVCDDVNLALRKKQADSDSRDAAPRLSGRRNSGPVSGPTLCTGISSPPPTSRISSPGTPQMAGSSSTIT
ncbi:hypothetical protein DX980_20375 (plasmid) [Burkholderia gladioli]|nr:hypothetical protein DX980_20375 [Burkholderia gladioli]